MPYYFGDLKRDPTFRELATWSAPKNVGLKIFSRLRVFQLFLFFQVMSNPVDVAKTRLMNQKAEEGKPLLLGHVPCSGRGLRRPCVAGLPNFTPESVRLYRSTVQTMSTIAQQAGKLSASDDFGVRATLDMLSRRDLWPCTRVFRPPLLGNALTRLGEVSVIVLNFFFAGWRGASTRCSRLTSLRS